MLVIYGIPNCDTVKKAKKYLDEHSIDYKFHNFKKDGVTKDLIESWLEQVPPELLINKRGTTWRALPDETKQNLTAQLAVELALENPSIIKRPVVDNNGEFSVGFKAQDWDQRFIKE
ncbi:arsenate reductase-like protein [Catenovulum agarivorans DS-2]|uniref:Arsenate reductase-like protein n=1 Tax=Catenovulum agarivorans DS-2 TaxID=1328313 RepID=W7QHE9_9ALTE|nr:arsenate reductase [Catenovulum agarivorans]EWH12374.1 arsenate reductase-like protein [Catenovulum agarivorans DS-2]